MNEIIKNPFRPGAGHRPPYLAGREEQTEEFKKLLKQDVILENMVLTGLRGVGKTVLLETFKPLALQAGWLWVGTDLSETATLSEANISRRLMTDLAMVTYDVELIVTPSQGMGFFHGEESKTHMLTFDVMAEIFDKTPGLISDKLKTVLEIASMCLSKKKGFKGLIFAYDEAQNLADKAEKDQFPLSAILLDTFQSLQKKNVLFMLVLTGLPTLFPKLVKARTFAERMFRVVMLDRLNEAATFDAITKPCELDASCDVKFNESAVKNISKFTGGYPYFIQFICREAFDIYIQNPKTTAIPMEEIVRKLDTDFFAGRWSRASDRQRDLLTVIAFLENSEEEFTVQEVVEKSKEKLDKPFQSSHVNQMLSKLSDDGLVYKNRYGKYSFAVPLLGGFILRELKVKEEKGQGDN